jgi:hypothetical protein
VLDQSRRRCVERDEEKPPSRSGGMIFLPITGEEPLSQLVLCFAKERREQQGKTRRNANDWY